MWSSSVVIVTQERNKNISSILVGLGKVPPVVQNMNTILGIETTLKLLVSEIKMLAMHKHDRIKVLIYVQYLKNLLTGSKQAGCFSKSRTQVYNLYMML